MVNKSMPMNRYYVVISFLFTSKLFSFDSRLFLLPHKDQRQMHFALNIDPAIKQGQTRYHYLVIYYDQL